MINSISKSFTATAIGFAVDEGLLTVEDQVIRFLSDNVTHDSRSNLEKMKIKHLLTMSSGHSVDTTRRMRESENWVQSFLNIPIDREPGSHFLYNTGASYILSAIVQTITGETLLEYLRPRLFEPLGIETPSWTSSPQGVNVGGFGMSIRTEDIAKFGQLYLQKGLWNGERIISEAWINEATRKHISTGTDVNSDWSQGYGYQFWRCRHGAYRADGAFGQFCVVLPEQDAVFITTGGTMNTQTVLNLLWEHITPSMSVGRQETPDVSIPLNRIMEHLELTTPIRQSNSVIPQYTCENFYILEENGAGFKALKFELDTDKCILTLWDKHGSQIVVCGMGSWAEGTLIVNGSSVKISANGAWKTSSVFVMTWSFLELPFTDTVTCHFVGDSVQISTSRNLWLSPLSSEAFLPTLTGTIMHRQDI